MWTALVNWYKSHTITTKSLTALAVTLTTLYTSVPAFQTLVLNTYNSFSPNEKTWALAIVGVVGYFLLANRNSVAPPPPTVLPSSVVK